MVAETLVNGASDDTSALIEGGKGAGATSVQNFGTISAFASDGRAVFAFYGAEVFNGSSADTAARIAGGFGVEIAGGSRVVNYGTISGSNHAGIYDYIGAATIVVLNGALGDTSARIQGVGGFQSFSSGSIQNYGTIDGVPQSGVGMGTGIDFTYGGVVHNGGGGDVVAVIEGTTGIYAKSAYASVSNAGSILGDYGAPGYTGALGDGIELLEGGAVSNGSASNTTALVKGAVGVDIESLPGTVVNFGTVLGDYGYGVRLSGAGNVTNGSLTDTVARIEGYGGVYFDSNGTVANLGTVTAVSYDGHGLFGVDLAAPSGGSLVNGAAGHAAALIEGYIGVRAGGAGATVVNFGTIVGTGGGAVALSASNDVLMVEAGSAFIGAIQGAGAMLDLDSGVGLLSGLISPAGNIIVSGSMAPTTFSDFATLEIGAGANFATSGAVALAAKQSVIDLGALTIGGGKAPGASKVINAGMIEAEGAGTLTVNGLLANSGLLRVAGGLLQVTGAVSGSGRDEIEGGTLYLLGKSNQGVAFIGKGGVLELGQSGIFTGKISGFSTVASLDLRDIGFVSPAEATFSGGRNSGVLTVTDGENTAHITLEGDYRAVSFLAAGDGHGGVVVEEKPQALLMATPPNAVLALAAAMANLGARVEAVGIGVHAEWSRTVAPALVHAP